MEQINDFLRYAKKQVEDSLLELSKKYCEPSKLYKPVWEFVLSGGKRLRPAIVLLAARTAGNERNAVIPATSIELLHNFTLIHDDIMDRSEFRRQIPTVYKKYGINQAILSGDVLMILAFEILKYIPSQLKPMIFEKLAEAARIVCEGQQYDMDINWETATSKDYFNIVSRKTAALLKSAAEIGVIAADPENISLRKTLGNAMFYAGIAFQIIDDYIDLFSDQTGKTRGLDIKEKKPTAIIVAINKQNPSVREHIWKLIEEFNSNGLDLQSLTSVLTAHCIDKEVISMADRYLQRSLKLIQNIESPNSELWKSLVITMVKRKL